MTALQQAFTGDSPGQRRVANIIVNYIRYRAPEVGDVIRYDEVEAAVAKRYTVSRCDMELARALARDTLMLQGDPSYVFAAATGIGWVRVEGRDRIYEGVKRERRAAKCLWRAAKIYERTDQSILDADDKRRLEHVQRRVEAKRRALTKLSRRMKWTEDGDYEGEHEADRVVGTDRQEAESS